jgi:predicted transcriptional regulator
MFEIAVVTNTPLVPLNDIEEVVTLFMNQIGYFPNGYNPKTKVSTLRESVPYRMFVEFFLARPDRAWIAEDLALNLHTTKATIYRHINKLKGFDIIEGMNVEDVNGNVRKGYRIRYGNLSKAWNFTEVNVESAMKNYRATVDHLQNLSQKRKSQTKARRKPAGH